MLDEVGATAIMIAKAVLFGVVLIGVVDGSKSRQEPSSTAEPSIVIIGAGISGLAAADRLINTYKFKNVTILEALNRVGGRIHPVPFGDGEGYIQIGAQYLHDRKNPVFDMALKLGLLPSRDVEPDSGKGTAYADQRGCNVPRKLRGAFLKFAGGAFKGLESWSSSDGASYGDVMEGMYKKFVTRAKHNESDVAFLDAMFRAFKSSIEQFYSAEDWRQISISEQIESSENATNENDDSDEDDDEGSITISMGKTGYKAILNEMTTRVPPSKYVKYNSRVQRIRWNGSSNITTVNQSAPANSKAIRIDLADGRVVNADHVIVTSSLGHLKHYAREIFQPGLPKAKLDTIDAVGFDAVDKLWLVFDKAYWSNNTTSINFIRVNNGNGEVRSGWNGTEAMQETNLTRMFEVTIVKQMPPTMLVWIGSKDPEAFEASTDDQVLQAATAVVRKFLNNPNIPPPRILRSAWYTNPLFHGSYSYDSVACEKINCKRRALAEPLYIEHGSQKIPVVLFAGEATNTDGQYATTHGAFVTGLREADRLGTFYSRIQTHSDKSPY